jgi:TonB family protein
MGEEGTVVLRVHVDEQGVPTIVILRSSSGFPRLDEAARKAVQSWRFVPARRGNEPVDAFVTVPIVFTLISDTKQSNGVVSNDAPLSKSTTTRREQASYDTEQKIVERRKENEAAERWRGDVKSKQDLLREGHASADRSSQFCPPGTPVLRADNLARHEVVIEGLLSRVIAAHEDYLRRKTTKNESAELFNKLKSEVEASRDFYNGKISRHCAIGKRMIDGLEKSKQDTLTAINLLNNFVRDLNANN